MVKRIENKDLFKYTQWLQFNFRYYQPNLKQALSLMDVVFEDLGVEFVFVNKLKPRV